MLDLTQKSTEFCYIEVYRVQIQHPLIVTNVPFSPDVSNLYLYIFFQFKLKALIEYNTLLEK